MRAADLRSSPARLGRGLLPDLDRARLETIVRLAIFVALGGVAAVAAAYSPISLIVGAVALGGIWLVAWRGRPQRVFHHALIGLLLGYALFGRNLAHVGVAPLYIGELVLGLGVISTVLTVRTFRGGPVRLLIIAFMIWGAIQTIPYIGHDGVDALRDAVTWGYGLFALIVSVSITGRHFDRILDAYRTIIPLYCLWIPFWLVLPENDFVSVKAGDVGVFLAGIAAFALLGLYSETKKPKVPEAIMWLLWLPAAATVAIFNRGGTVAMLAAGAVVFFLRLPKKWLPPIFFTLLIGLVVIWADPKVQLAQGVRPISVSQFVDNIASIVTEGEGGALEGTKEFRLRWWGDIIDYTINGPFFWTGKGFGINLADDDGFQVYEDHSLRAPHNGHFEILARSGVPGLTLWILLNAALGLGLLRAARGAQALGRSRWVAIDGWLFVAWAAALVNASFDPSLQGPHAGIWFWSMVGLAIVAIEASTQPDEVPPIAPAPGTIAQRPPQRAGGLPRPA
jgi:O-Antigen ligase